MHLQGLRLVFLLAILLGVLSSVARAGTTTADFLKWERKAQASFFQASIGMAGVIASQINPKIAKCIDQWYFVPGPLQMQREEKMLMDMSAYGDYHPSAVILGFVQQACGDFKTSR